MIIRRQSPAPSSTGVELPANLPALPESASERIPELKKWEAEMREWYSRLRGNLRDIQGKTTIVREVVTSEPSEPEPAPTPVPPPPEATLPPNPVFEQVRVTLPPTAKNHVVRHDDERLYNPRYPIGHGATHHKTGPDPILPILLGSVEIVEPPETPGDAGELGQIAMDEFYLYIYTTSNLWGRIALPTSWT